MIDRSSSSDCPKIQGYGRAVTRRQFQLLLIEHIRAAPHFTLHQATPLGFAVRAADGARRDIQRRGQLPQGRQAITFVQYAVADIACQRIGNRQIHRLAEFA